MTKSANAQVQTATRSVAHPYPKYKSVTSRWFDELPASWSALRAKWLFSNEKERSDESDEQLAASQKYGVISQQKMIELNNAKVMLALKGTENFKKVRRNDFVISLRSFEGGIEHSKYDGCISPAYTVLRRRSVDFDPRYFRYVLKCEPFIKALNSTSEGIRDGKTITYEEFGELIVALPPVVDQAAIACYLDREIARIDNLIAEKQNFINLLKEKRQALISHVATKGLDPKVKMKESGIEWIGEVPEHWIISRVKYEYKNLDGRRIPLSAEERGERQGQYPYYGASGIIDHVDGYLFDEPLVLVSEDGANLLMRTYPIAFVASGEYWVNNHAHILKPKDDYVEYWADLIELIDLTPYVSGSAQPKLTSEALGRLYIAYPPDIQERRSIAEKLLLIKKQIQTLMDETARSVELLKEHRTALISAAVTGKIDVRDRL